MSLAGKDILGFTNCRACIKKGYCILKDDWEECFRLLSLQKDNWKGSITVSFVTKDLNASHDGPREIVSMIKGVYFEITAEPPDNNVV